MEIQIPSNPLQDPEVFARCFKRPYFAKPCLQAVLRGAIWDFDPDNVGLFEFEHIDGTIGHVVHIEGLRLGKGQRGPCTVLVQLEPSNISHMTARQVDANFHPETTDEFLYIVTFTPRLIPAINSPCPVFKFCMQDRAGNQLCDKRWLIFVTYELADNLDSVFLHTLCLLLQNKECESELATSIMDAATSVAVEVQREHLRMREQLEAEEAKDMENYGVSHGGVAPSVPKFVPTAFRRTDTQKEQEDTRVDGVESSGSDPTDSDDYALEQIEEDAAQEEAASQVGSTDVNASSTGEGDKGSHPEHTFQPEPEPEEAPEPAVFSESTCGEDDTGDRDGEQDTMSEVDNGASDISTDPIARALHNLSL